MLVFLSNGTLERITARGSFATTEKLSTRVLYGASVTAENAATFLRVSGADGLLVGGASLDPESFRKIIDSIAS